MSPAQQNLFDLSGYPIIEKGLELKPLNGPVWTGNKARLIKRYLQCFTYVTKHGTYLDAFAGPQSASDPDTWAAKLVLEAKPAWLRHFALFELNPKSYQALAAMVKKQSPIRNRDVQHYQGDTNILLPKFLAENPIKDTEATFCLLDQRTFECDWATVEAVARHKKGGHKIEQFYFLAQAWIDRAFSGLKKDPHGDLARWWGNEGYKEVVKKPSLERGLLFADRFKKELGYAYAYSFPIYEKAAGGKLMFHMIHASDHPDAPKLMFRAYNQAIAAIDNIEQLELLMGDFMKKPAKTEA